MPLFSKHKSPRELIQVICENFQILNSNTKNEKERRKAIDEIARTSSTLHELLTDKSDTRLTGKERDADLTNSERARISEIIIDVTHEIVNLNLLPLLINNLDAIEFESSKHIVNLFGHIMKRSFGSHNPAEQYLLTNPHILISLLKGYSKPGVATHYGTMLRDACRHESLAKVVLYSPEFYLLFEFVQGTAFEVISDALDSLKDLLFRHKELTAEFLRTNYDTFFPRYKQLIESHCYVTKRQALKLLGELLLDRYNSAVMRKYVGDPDNLKTLMNVLPSEQKQVAFEAFHCFKVFVANPDKNVMIQTILYRNQKKLIDFLQKFDIDRPDDGQFNDEKQYLIKQIRDLKPPPNMNPNVTSTVASTTTTTI